MLNQNMFKSRLVAAGLNQSALASLIGVSKNTMSAKINGKSAFDTKQIEAICKVLGIQSGTEKAKIFLGQSSQNRDDQ